METFFFGLALLQILLGLYMVYQAARWLGYSRKRVATDPGFYSPRTAVFCPCRGVEPGLERNLTSLCEFDHQNYEVFFSMASETDPAASIVKRVVAQSKGKAHLTFAGTPQECSEKINNLRAAIEQLPPEFEVLVFADSDGRPGRSWLRRLTGPLTDSRIGATTTMRWLIANNNSLPSLLLAAWNAPIVSMLGEDPPKNFCWEAERPSVAQFSIARGFWKSGSTR